MKSDRSAGFETCCLADFKIGDAWNMRNAFEYFRRAGLETCGTADLEVCATHFLILQISYD